MQRATAVPKNAKISYHDHVCIVLLAHYYPSQLYGSYVCFLVIILASTSLQVTQIVVILR